MTKHVVLGGNGVVGMQTISALADRGLTVTSVNRQLHEIPNGEAVQADLKDRDDAVRAIDGAEVAYLVLGLPHSMTYTPDIGAALAILGTDPRGRNGVWHVPTAPALTGEDYLAMATGANRAHKVMPKTVLRLGGLFVPAARESLELSYQNTEPYLFDSTKFELMFGVSTTPYREGIARTLQRAQGR